MVEVHNWERTHTELIKPIHMFRNHKLSFPSKGKSSQDPATDPDFTEPPIWARSYLCTRWLTAGAVWRFIVKSDKLAEWKEKQLIKYQIYMQMTSIIHAPSSWEKWKTSMAVSTRRQEVWRLSSYLFITIPTPFFWTSLSQHLLSQSILDFLPTNNFCCPHKTVATLPSLCHKPWNVCV